MANEVAAIVLIFLYCVVLGDFVKHVLPEPTNVFEKFGVYMAWCGVDTAIYGMALLCVMVVYG